MDHIHHIIEKFGGVRPMARALNLSPMAVQNWKRTGFIPARRQPEVIAAASKVGAEVRPQDFFKQTD